MPATLSPEIMTTLLRERLGFNGMAVTDASHMAGMTEALTRILGLKAHLGLYKKSKEELVPQPQALDAVLGKQEYKEMQKAFSRDSSRHTFVVGFAP